MARTRGISVLLIIPAALCFTTTCEGWLRPSPGCSPTRALRLGSRQARPSLAPGPARALCAPRCRRADVVNRLNKIDPDLCKCDVSVLATCSLGRSCVDIITTGTFDPDPTITAQDLVDISHAFNSAASLSLGWILAALVMGKGAMLQRPLERDRDVALRQVVLVYAVAVPLVLSMRVVALFMGGGAAVATLLLDGLPDVPNGLAAIVLWRVFLAPGLLL
mmetsp:Transcript_24099/g.75117  ORF Transcript_24099/g.75117 Transcript_24099/m.75117 type:complete len:220 (+) Transcript_24099:1-660(+)